jgi:hypothetical protein
MAIGNAQASQKKFSSGLDRILNRALGNASPELQRHLRAVIDQKTRPSTKPGALKDTGAKLYANVIELPTNKANNPSTNLGNQPSQPAAFNLGQEAPQPAPATPVAAEFQTPNDANDLRAATAYLALAHLDRAANADAGNDQNQKPDNDAAGNTNSNMSSMQQQYASMYPGLSEAQIQALIDGPDGHPHHKKDHKHHEEHIAKAKHDKHHDKPEQHHDVAHHKEHKPNVAPKGPDFGHMT